MKKIVYFGSFRDNLYCGKYENNEFSYITDYEKMKIELLKILKTGIEKWKIKDDEFGIYFKNNIIVLENINLIDNEFLKPLKIELNKKLFEKKIKQLKNNAKYVLKKTNTKTKVTFVVSTIIVSTICGIAINNNSQTKKERPEVIKPYKISENVEDTYQDKTYENNEVIITKRFQTEDYKKEQQNIIDKYAKMYYIDNDVAKNLISENKNELNKYSTFEIGVIQLFKTYYWEQSNIDKTPIVSNLTEKEKEAKILEFANVYCEYDEDVLATLIAVHRLETGYGTSKVYLEYNNCAGVMEYDNEGNYVPVKYKTFDMGAESFTDVFLKVKKQVLEKAQNNEEGFDINKSLAYNMDSVYCGEEIPEGQPKWYEIVEELKEHVKEEGILNNYCQVSFDKKNRK